MKYIDFDFNGERYALSFTADALFAVYDKFGVRDDLLAATGVLEPTEEGWTSCCWLLALLAMQGELQRRHRGEDPRPMLRLEDLRTGVMAGDVPYIRAAVRSALEQGLRCDLYKPEETAQEINLVLQAREEQEGKKEPLPALSALDTLRRQLKSFLSLSAKPSF